MTNRSCLPNGLLGLMWFSSYRMISLLVLLQLHLHPLSTSMLSFLNQIIFTSSMNKASLHDIRQGSRLRYFLNSRCYAQCSHLACYLRITTLGLFITLPVVYCHAALSSVTLVINRSSFFVLFLSFSLFC